MSHSVTFRERNYKRERCELPAQAAVIHPLKVLEVVEGKMTRTTKEITSKQAKVFSRSESPADPLDPLSSNSASVIDPLSGGAKSDPLSQMTAELPSKSQTSRRSVTALLDTKSSQEDFLEDDVSPGQGMEPWGARRTGILLRYTTTEKLSIVSSFLTSQGENVRVVGSGRRAGEENVMDKVKSRLEQLDTFEEGSVTETSNLSQQEFIDKIQELQTALRNAWDSDQRVKALQIVIQCTKLLSDTSAVQFYPSKFVLITDILDLFGNLVFSRLKSKSSTTSRGARAPTPLPDNFKPSQVPEAAKETARNWFFKIASVRELMPRLYVEAAIIRCYRFVDPLEINKSLKRLMSMCRGIADPLVATYTRCYIARMGVAISPNYREHISDGFDDFLLAKCQLQSGTLSKVVGQLGVDIPTYMTLFTPSLDWLLQCICAGMPDEKLFDFLKRCQDTNIALLINSALSSFPPHFISAQADTFARLITELDDASYPKHLLCQQLGVCLVMSWPEEHLRLPVLNEIWKLVTTISLPREYILCADAWAEYVAKHFGKKQLNFFLGDVIRHVTSDRAFESLYGQLQSILNKILVHVTDFQVLFDSEQFLRFLDLFEKEHIKLDVYKGILEACLRQFSGTTTSDPVLIEACLSLARQLHDCLNSLSVDDERRAIAKLVVGFISHVDMGSQLEKQLDFYVTCRAGLSNLEPVLSHLVERVNSLAMRAHAFRRGNHTAKTGAFARACIAYSFITIPSLTDWAIRIRLYLSTSQVALVNGCLGQADACLKTAITLLLEVNKQSGGVAKGDEAVVQELSCALASSLLMAPDNVGQGCLYLLKGLLNALQAFSWDPNSDGKFHVFLKVLALISALCQPRYLYRAGTTDANDRLYGGDPKFTAELAGISSTLVTELLAHLKTLDAGPRRSDLALGLFSVLLHYGDLENSQETRHLASNLWTWATKAAGGKLEKALLETVRAKAANENSPAGAFAKSLLS